MHAESQEQILEAALRRFAAHGVSRSTLEHVAEEAGVTLGVVRGYFPDRDTLLRELVQSITEPMVASIALLSRDTDNPREWLRRSLRLYEQLVQENPLYVDLMQRVMLDEPETLARLYNTALVPSEFYARLMAFAKEGKFRISDPFMIGLFLDCMLIFPHMLGSLMQRYSRGESLEDFHERKLEAMLTLLEGGLFTDQDGS